MTWLHCFLFITTSLIQTSSCCLHNGSWVDAQQSCLCQGERYYRGRHCGLRSCGPNGHSSDNYNCICSKNHYGLNCEFIDCDDNYVTIMINMTDALESSKFEPRLFETCFCLDFDRDRKCIRNKSVSNWVYLGIACMVPFAIYGYYRKYKRYKTHRWFFTSNDNVPVTTITPPHHQTHQPPGPPTYDQISPPVELVVTKNVETSADNHGIPPPQ